MKKTTLKSLKQASKQISTKHRIRNSDCEFVLIYDDKKFHKEMQELNSGNATKIN